MPRKDITSGGALSARRPQGACSGAVGPERVGTQPGPRNEHGGGGLTPVGDHERDLEVEVRVARRRIRADDEVVRVAGEHVVTQPFAALASYCHLSVCPYCVEVEPYTFTGHGDVEPGGARSPC